MSARDRAIKKARMTETLLEHLANARKVERQRLIQILENDKVNREPHCQTEGCKECPVYEDGFNDAIALIRGEDE